MAPASPCSLSRKELYLTTLKKTSRGGIVERRLRAWVFNFVAEALAAMVALPVEAKEAVKVFKDIFKKTGFVGWGELANPNNQKVTPPQMLDFVPQPNLQKVLSQSLKPFHNESSP